VRAALQAGALCSLLACGGLSSTAGPPLWAQPGFYGAIRPEMGHPQPGDAAPDFELPSREGAVRLASLRGHWTLLHFTASWCPYCDAEVEHLGELATAYAKLDLHVVLIGVMEEPGHWNEYAATHVARSVVVLNDVDGAVSRTYAPPRAQPSFKDRSQVVLDSTVIVDPEGKIRLFLFPDSKHFDPTFRAVRGELDRLLVVGVASPAAKRPGEPAADGVVTIDVTAPGRVAAGEASEITVVLSIAPGYHVMSDHPSDPWFIATRVRFDDAAGVSWKEPRYPPAVPFELDGRTIATFRGKAVLSVPFILSRDADPAVRRVDGSVRYQACTEGSCLFPVTRRMTATIDVAPSSPL
jgi:peroxiredoxin